MSRKLALALVLAATGLAQANGRPPNTSTINFRQGMESHIIAGMTFGAIVSKDNGATWHWFCEKAILYGGMYDPDYAYKANGSIFATTFDGSLVNRDGCVFQPTTFGKKFISSITQGPDGALYMAAADVPDGMGSLGDAKIYKSIDNGMTFNAGATAGQINDWYSSIEVAPTDPQRVYLSAYRLGNLGARSFFLYKSTDGGQTFAPMSTAGLVASDDSTIDIVGIKRGAPDTLFIRITVQTGMVGDAIWRSDNAGQTWTKILEKQDSLAFAIRANGDLVAAGPTAGMFVARGPTNATWDPVPNAPHINCLVENSAGELWACTQNYGAMQIPSDDAGIMKTTDLTSWTKVLRFQDIAGPVDCPAGTRQHDQCVYDCADMTYDMDPAQCPNLTPRSWCILKNQLGITSTAIVCPLPEVDAPPEVDGPKVSNKPGCCGVGDTGGAPAALALSLAVGAVIVRTRRRTVR